ncbi:hypothetical protein QR680_003209 [Steinernema hermaphroditum]|uniref:Nucleoporin NUP35 n=1 Tax=Steinernema hermaphroditum TaxID=289476 RepID=A0AA39H601_9BILA|nr:hypothetical protein QR680_003209 [Steinernema hermaphroditum]
MQVFVAEADVAKLCNMYQYPREMSQRMSPEPMAFEGGADGAVESPFAGRQKNPIQSSEVVAPGFLFGGRDKRRSFLMTPSQQRTPGRAPLSSSKTVTWSPALTQTQHSPRTSTSFYDSDSEAQTISSSPTTFRPPRLVPGGPPLRSLGDDIFKKPKLCEASSMESLSAEENDPLAFEKEANAPVATENEHEFWVKVLGHKPDETDEVIKFFGRHGSLVSYKIPEDGNWVWIRYSSPLHVNQALSRSGRFFRPNTILAVFPCTEKDVPYANSEEVLSQSEPLPTNRAPSRFLSGLERNMQPAPTLNESVSSINPLETSSLDATQQRPGIRSLSTSYRAAANNSISNNVFPHKASNDSLLDKVWNFIAP